MSMKRFTLLLAAAMLSAGALFAATPHLSIEHATHSFGNIKEADGPVSHEFVVTNDGDAPLIIKSARASCGCTTPVVPKAPIRPGEKGVIKVTYDPLGRPGEFEKNITVRHNGKPSKTQLRIKGVVIPRK